MSWTEHDDPLDRNRRLGYPGVRGRGHRAGVPVRGVGNDHPDRRGTPVDRPSRGEQPVHRLDEPPPVAGIEAPGDGHRPRTHGLS
jgi:hypothetical protein